MYRFIIKQPFLVIFPILIMGALFVTGSAALPIIAILAFIGYLKNGILLPFITLMVLLPFADSSFSFVSVAYNARPVILFMLSGIIIISEIKPKIDSSFKGFIVYFLVLSYYLYDKSSLIEVSKSLSYFLVIFTTPVVVRYLIKTEKDSFLRLLIFIYTIIYIISFINIGENISLENYDRFSGIFSNPNGLGIFSFLFFMLTQIIFKYQPQLFTKIERFAVTLIVVLGLLYSKSRSGIFAAAIFWLSSFAYEKWKFKGLIIVCFTLFFINSIFSYEDVIRGLGLADFLRVESLETGSGRKVAIQEAWVQIKKRPIEGYGIGYSESYFEDNQEELNAKGHVGGIHNSFQWVWLDLGLYGLIPFVFGWFMWFQKSFKYSYQSLPVGLAVFFSANIESWLMGSLNHVTIQLIIILSLLSSPSFLISPNNPVSQRKSKFS